MQRRHARADYHRDPRRELRPELGEHQRRGVEELRSRADRPRAGLRRAAGAQLGPRLSAGCRLRGRPRGLRPEARGFRRAVRPPRDPPPVRALRLLLRRRAVAGEDRLADVGEQSRLQPSRRPRSARTVRPRRGRAVPGGRAGARVGRDERADGGLQPCHEGGAGGDLGVRPPFLRVPRSGSIPPIRSRWGRRSWSICP